MEIRSLVWAVQPDLLMEDSDRPEVPGWDLKAIWTPGHSPGHLCFYEPTNRLMLSGDHVLPRITPNISFHPMAGPDPLGDFLTSLDKVAAYDTPTRCSPRTSIASSTSGPVWPSCTPAPRGPFRRGRGVDRRGGPQNTPHVGDRQPHDLVAAVGAG